jgi:predicted alpha/beta-fold hydrolase
VNPPIDLDRCASAIERPGNRIYRIQFVLGLCRQVRRARRFHRVEGPEPIARRIRTVRRFDDLFTAPDAGYRSAAEYYADASAGPRLHGIRRPTLILSAKNDPFVPVEMFAPHHGTAGIRFLHPSAGGHCGYWQASRPRFWAAERILEFASP